MTEKIIYVAYDGKEFTDKSSCIKYESDSKYSRLAKMYEEIPEQELAISRDFDSWTRFTGDFTDITSNYDSPTAVMVSSQRGLDFLHTLAKDLGWSAYADIDETGVWKYNFCADERFEKLMKL